MSKHTRPETIAGDLTTVREIENGIPEIINTFCERHKIEDLTKESSNIFNALLIDINEQIIRPNKHILLLPNRAHNKYNPDTLYELLLVYEKLCLLYDNAITIYGFGLLSGLDRMSIYRLADGTTPQEYTHPLTGERYKPSHASCDVWEKLRESEEQTTLNCRKYNDLRIIARLNRITGGAYRDYTQVDTAQTRVESTPEAIADKYGETAGNKAFLPADEG